MGKKTKDFYVWTFEECIKDTYEGWGIDMMSMYDNIQESFPNAAQVIREMYYDFDAEDYFLAKPCRYARNNSFFFISITDDSIIDKSFFTLSR